MRGHCGQKEHKASITGTRHVEIVKRYRMDMFSFELAKFLQLIACSDPLSKFARFPHGNHLVNMHEP